ncbi:MAG: sulfur carrier protein ThiS [Alphaproteobacteria bacterium]|nr:sulfur carrier protein ThiS [Alphaproteobacteria bacterium]
MIVRLNGKERELPDASTVKSMLVELGSDRPGVAVAIDGRVVPRSAHGDTTLHAGAVVEVIRAVGGG